MVDRRKALLMVLIALLIYPNDIFGGAFPPEFAAPISNLTVALGRDATFTCLVKHLGGYRVGWLKVDSKAIQAIHDHVITHNNRVSVSHSDHTMWNLHIKNVQQEDEGLYMCQINTDPMKSQTRGKQITLYKIDEERDDPFPFHAKNFNALMNTEFTTGMLSIVVPPDFISEDTSSDVMVREGGQVKLTCRARGVPPPRLLWKREDGKNIVIRKPFAGSALNQKSHVSAVSEYQGEELKLTKISRNEMGVYLCIASNGVPPAVSKRIFINVHFSPVIHVPNQLVGAPLSTDVVLECFVEASPKSINYWVKDNAMIISSQQHDVQAIMKSQFEVRMMLTIRNLQKTDVGNYKCVAKNSLGDVESSIRLYEISGPAKTQTAARPSFYDEEDETVYGSAEMEKMENKPLSVDNTINGHHVGYPSVATPVPTVRMGKKRPAITSSKAGHHLVSNILIVFALIVVHQRCQ